MDRIKLRPSHLKVFESLARAEDNIKNILEFGSGEFSTLFFCKQNWEVHSVEYDKQWSEHVSEICSEFTNRSLLQYTLDIPFTRGDLPKNLSPDRIRDAQIAIERFFDRIEKNELTRNFFDIIFVDCYAATRNYVIDQAYHYTSILVIHDTEMESKYAMTEGLNAARAFYNLEYTFKDLGQPDTKIFTDYEYDFDIPYDMKRNYIHHD